MQRFFHNILLLTLALSCVAPVCHAQAPKTPTLEKDSFDDFIALRMKTERRRATFKDAVTPAFSTSAEGWEGRDYSFFPEESPEAALGVAYLNNLDYSHPFVYFPEIQTPPDESEPVVESDDTPPSPAPASAPTPTPAPTPAKRQKTVAPPPEAPAPPEAPQQNEHGKGHEKKEEAHKWQPGDNLKKAGKKVNSAIKETFGGKKKK